MDHFSYECFIDFLFTDSEDPQVFGCPKSFKLYTSYGESTVADVSWKEPVFKDNVEVMQVYKSMASVLVIYIIEVSMLYNKEYILKGLVVTYLVVLRNNLVEIVTRDTWFLCQFS